jgi:DNA-binding NarL/FixJ family response regulator
MNKNLKIIIVDDHALFREGLKLLIEEEEIGEVIAEAENGQVFLDLLAENTPDLVLMDIEMPVVNGLQATIKAMAVRPGLKILALTQAYNKDKYTNMLNAGVMGIVLKNSGKHELETAIKTVIAGNRYYQNEQESLLKIDTTFSFHARQ